jgi:2-oxoisovalerate dehydrogenase E1 component
VNPPTHQQIYRSLFLIRRFEETVLENFARGLFHGTTHTCLGQEANAVGVIACLQADDIIFSNHRGHGHFLAYGGDPHALFAELMGKASGVCGGRGGSQHLHWRNFYSNGVQGGIVPVATGMALAEKRKGSGALAVCFLGDGTLGEGVIYESFNLAALWQAPILYVIENNRIAQTTPVEQAVAGSIAARLTAFGIPVLELDSSDVLEIRESANHLLTETRAGAGPRGLLIHTHRFGSHSKGDDTRIPRLVADLRAQRDPLQIQAGRLAAGERAVVEAQVESQIGAAFQQAMLDPLPALEQSPAQERPLPVDAPAGEAQTVLQSLNAALHQAMQADGRVLLLGEDILDPYGGAFKVTRGLSTVYPARVLATPISEAGIVGVAAGMALRGLRPVVEIMFGDFVTLIADQVINHIAKFRWMYHDQVRLSLVIRTPMGGRRGYGPTHSQTLERLFLGVPGLKVVAPCALAAGTVLQQAIADDDPVFFVENKLLYLAPLQPPGSLPDFEVARAPQSSRYPTFRLTIRGAPAASLTLAAYGYMAELARQAAWQLAYEHEIFVELVIPTRLSPVESAALEDSVRRTGRLLVVEEGSLTLGWGAEIVARLLELTGTSLRAARRVAALDLPVPASATLEQLVLPGVAEIVQAARQMF